MSSSATGVGMTICFLGAILLILTQKSSQKFGDVLGIMDKEVPGADPATFKEVDFYIGQDKHRAYNKGIPTQIKDYSKLTEVGRLMYSDGTNIYDSHFNILPKADVATFEHISDNWYKVEKPRDFDPFGHAGFAHLWLQYD